MKDYNRRCLILTDEAMTQAKQVKEWYPRKYKDNSQFFELAGNHLYGVLKRRHEREQG